MTQRVVIASAVRTPFTRAKKGELKDTRPDTMAAWVMKEAVRRVPGLKPEAIEDVILGCAMPEGEQGMNVARVATIGAGFPVEVPGITINRFCASGVQSIAYAAMGIQFGSIDVAIAGGTETMSMIPMGGKGVSINPEIFAEHPEVYSSMGATAENVVSEFGVAREEMDVFAYNSQRKATEAIQAGRLKDEIVPVTTKLYDAEGIGREVTVDYDTIVRQDTTLEGLRTLRGAFRPKGIVTAGNSSPLTDGAGACVVMSEQRAEKMGINPLGYFVDYVVVGVRPEIMGIGPFPAIDKLLKKRGLTVDDIDLFEVNEAFASQAVYVQKQLGIPDEKLNPNGGAIALGHPLGVSGTRLTATILYELRRRKAKYGIVSMCIGGGMGAAALIESIPAT